MVKVLPVPALACSSVMPRREGPRRRRRAAGPAALGARHWSDHLLVREQAVPEPARVERRTACRSDGAQAASSASRRPERDDHRVERQRGPEDQHVLGLLVLVVPVGTPTPGTAPPRRRGSSAGATASAQAADVLQYSGKRLAHAALEEIHQRPAGGARRSPAGWPRRARAGRHAPPRWRTRPLGPGRWCSASKGRSGQAAVRASRRSHAIRRAAGPSLEYVTVCTTSPRTPGDRADEAEPAGQRRRANFERDAEPPALCAGQHQLVQRVADLGQHGVGQPPRRQRATGQLGLEARLLAGAGEPRLQDRSAICQRSSASSSIGMASSKSRVLSRSEMPSRSRRKARTGWRRNRSSWSSPTGPVP